MPYQVSKIDKGKSNVKESIMEEPIDEILLTRSKLEKLAIHIPTLKENYLNVLSVADNIKASIETLLLCEKDTLHPLPENYKFRKMQNHNLTIRTYTHHENLLIMGEDLQRLNEIIELLNSLKAVPDRNEADVEPGYAVRRLSTGTFELFVTTLFANGYSYRRIHFFSNQRNPTSQGAQAQSEAQRKGTRTK